MLLSGEMIPSRTDVCDNEVVPKRRTRYVFRRKAKGGILRDGEGAGNDSGGRHKQGWWP